MALEAGDQGQGEAPSWFADTSSHFFLTWGAEGALESPL